MASLGHVAIGMAAGRFWAGTSDRKDLARTMVAFSALSLAADLDVIGFRFHIPYSAPFGHRGATHSICVALIFASCAAFAARLGPEQTRARLWLVCVTVAVSHGLLDTLTDGGLGVALLWPFSTHRYFAPWTPISVAPIGRGMLSKEGLRVVLAEALQFAPLLVWSLWPRRRTS
jgi:inner membrane protein